MKKNNTEGTPSRLELFNFKYKSSKVSFELNKKTEIEDSDFETIMYENLFKIWKIIKKILSIIILIYFH